MMIQLFSLLEGEGHSGSDQLLLSGNVCLLLGLKRMIHMIRMIALGKYGKVSKFPLDESMVKIYPL